MSLDLEALLAPEEEEKGQSYSYSDQDLIRQLVKSRLEQGQEIEYEDLSGYELPPRSQFSMVNKPAITIKYGVMYFNSACLRLFQDTYHILPLVHREKKRLTIVPCTDEEAASVQWARKRQKDDVKVTREIKSEEFILKLFRLMGWNVACRYKIMGRIAIANPGPMPVMVFDLPEAIMYEANFAEIRDKDTGEVLSKKQIKYYPDEYKDCIGKSYNDYVETRQMNIFEYLEEYAGQSYSDHEDTDEEADGSGVSVDVQETVRNQENMESV